MKRKRSLILATMLILALLLLLAAPPYAWAADGDGDGIPDDTDNCPNTPNPDQADVNNNRVGDDCDDFDADGVLNTEDNCPGIDNPDQADQDSDNVGDVCDNCPQHANPDQADKDLISVTFVHESNSPDEDCIEPGEVCFWRGKSGDVKNTQQGKIEWACGRCSRARPEDFVSRLQEIRDTCLDGDMAFAPGHDTCLHIIGSDTYWDILWLTRVRGGQDGGAFSYLRSTSDGIGDACESAFAGDDGQRPSQYVIGVALGALVLVGASGFYISDRRKEAS